MDVDKGMDTGISVDSMATTLPVDADRMSSFDSSARTLHPRIRDGQEDDSHTLLNGIISSGRIITKNNRVVDEEKGLKNIRDSQEQPNGLDPNLVNWNGPDDPGNPMNWSKARKWYITLIYSLLTFCITLSSSIFSQATTVTSSEFDVPTEVTTLGTSLTVLGFAFGPIIFGPFSEVYGRRLPLLIGFTISAIFQIPVAVAQNLATVLLSRFFVGMFGSAALAIVSGAVADIWDPVYRGIAAAAYASATFFGPVVGPIAGGFIVNSHLGWRWTAWITLILDVFFGIIAFFTIPETFSPVILQQRAARLRFETKNWALHSTLDTQRLTARDIFVKYLSRPILMLVLEPILLLTTLYLSLIYGILYLTFFAYPISFQEVRGWKNSGVAALPFIGLSIGLLSGSLFIIYLTKTRFARKLKEQGQVVPEERLPPMMVASVCLPAGLFWFSWTSQPDITWVPQAMAGVPIGFGIIVIFMQGLNYIVDVYLMFANSALAGNSLIRSTMAAVFPLFASQMYHRLGVQWAGSLLGFLTLAMIPIPILFYIYGRKIRAMSRYSPKL